MRYIHEMEQRPKKTVTNLRLDTELKELGVKAAADKRRSFTSLLETLLEDYLRKIGYLPKDK